MLGSERPARGGVFALLLAVVIGGAIYYASNYQITQNTEALQEKSVSLAKVLQQQLRSAVAFADVETAREAFDIAIQDKDVSTLALYDARGQAIYRAGPDALEAPPWTDDQRVAVDDHGITVIGPVRSLEGPRGLLVARLSRSRTDAKSAALVRGAVALGVVMALLCLCVGMLLRKQERILARVQAAQAEVLAVKEEEKRLLAAKERETMQFLDQLPTAVFVADAAGNPVFANKECVRISGIGAEPDARGQLAETYGVCRRGSSEQYPEHELPLVRALAGESVSATDMEISGPNGRIPVDAVASPILDESGGVLFAMCVFEDVTAKLQAETERLQSQKLESVGQLAAGIAHEINTPMQYIGDNAHFLKKVIPNLTELVEVQSALIEESCDESARAQAAKATKKLKIAYLRKRIPKALDSTIEGVDTVSVLVRSMKEFSHPGETEMASTDINHAIEMTLAVSRNEWKYVAEIEQELDPSLPEIPALRGELNQVFLNLVVNAAHAIADKFGDGQKGSLRLATRVVDECVEISIADNGAGIPDSVKQKVFDPFFTTKEVGKGAGQGLAIARSIVVDKHGGSIELESKVGEGTTFRILLPRVARDLEDAA